MDLRIIDPTAVPGWDAALLAGGDECIFHSAAWARTFAESYGYKPIYFAGPEGAGRGPLVPMMEVASHLTGRRGVSLPYTDYCPALAPGDGAMEEAFAVISEHGLARRWRYAEFRDTAFRQAGTPVWESYVTHDLDIRGTDDEVFSRFKENNQRNIKKSVKAGLTVRVGTDPESIGRFYRLNCLTRKRHGLPPQPPVFFRKLREHVIGAGYGAVVSAWHEGRVIAASVFFLFGRKAVFKYGASDPAAHMLRPNNLVMWEAVKWLRDQGCVSLNLGRTEAANQGLLQYKRCWGAVESHLDYYRFGFMENRFLAGKAAGEGPSPLAKAVFRAAPTGLLKMIGRLSYRHFG